MKKFMISITLVLISTFTFPVFSLASEIETSDRTNTQDIKLPEMNLEMTSDDEIQLLADSPGWQHIATDIWYVDNSTTTEPVSVAGDGVKVCFSNQNMSYAVELWEHDNLGKDEKLDTVTIGTTDTCVSWSGVNTEIGNEELYLVFTKASTKTEKIQVEWYD